MSEPETVLVEERVPQVSYSFKQEVFRQALESEHEWKPEEKSAHMDCEYIPTHTVLSTLRGGSSLVGRQLWAEKADGVKVAKYEIR